MIDWLQWPAMAVTVLAAWLVGARAPRRRKLGFWSFLFSNVLWVVWGWSTQAYALVLLQFALAAMNIRGAKKNESEATAKDDEANAPRSLRRRPKQSSGSPGAANRSGS